MRRFLKNDFVEFLDLDQDSEEWLDWRNKGIGSSDIALLMSPEPVFDRTVRILWEQRVGYERAVKLDNEHIRRGKELEPVIRDKVNTILGQEYYPVCVTRTDSEYLRASLDGYNKSTNSILEIKSPSEKIFNSYLESWSIPNNYYLQMQYQMLVCNADFGLFAFYNKDILKHDGEQEYEYPYIILVNPDFELQLEIEKRCSLFWYAVTSKIPIGWKDNKLTLFPQKRKVLYIIVDKKQAEKILSLNLPVNVYYADDECYDEHDEDVSHICLVENPLYLMTKYKNSKNDYISNLVDRKIISLVESPFCNKPNSMKITKSNIMNEFNSV